MKVSHWAPLTLFQCTRYLLRWTRRRKFPAGQLLLISHLDNCRSRRRNLKFYRPLSQPAGFVKILMYGRFCSDKRTVYKKDWFHYFCDFLRHGCGEDPLVRACVWVDRRSIHCVYFLKLSDVLSMERMGQICAFRSLGVIPRKVSSTKPSMTS